MGHGLLAVLAHNEIPCVVVEKEACCGMPKLELGDLESVDRLKKINIPVLSRLAKEGWAIGPPVPSCTLMFKQELPLMYPDDPDTLAVRDAMFDPFEYFVQRKKDGLLNTDFVEKLPGTTVNTVERCAGHDGTWGVKEEFFAHSMKIGRPVFRQMAEPD